MSPPLMMTSVRGCSPVGRLEAGDGDLEVLSLLDGDHLGGGLKAELLHHGLKVVLPWTLNE